MPSTSGKTFGCADLMSVKLLTISMVCVCVCAQVGDISDRVLRGPPGGAV